MIQLILPNPCSISSQIYLQIRAASRVRFTCKGVIVLAHLQEKRNAQTNYLISLCRSTQICDHFIITKDITQAQKHPTTKDLRLVGRIPQQRINCRSFPSENPVYSIKLRVNKKYWKKEKIQVPLFHSQLELSHCMQTFNKNNIRTFS